jgi:hypothetical protein
MKDEERLTGERFEEREIKVEKRRDEEKIRMGEI